MEDKFFNLDTHFAKTIASDLRTFAQMEEGFPSTYPNQEAWKSTLMSIAIPLERYATVEKLTVSLDREYEITYEAQQALKKFAEIFPSLWI